MGRYSRHYTLPGFSRETQFELSKKSIVVIGAGGLGSPALQYLVGAGVGYIHIIDHDTVSLDNLHRQILYNEEQIGDSKVRSAKLSLTKLNSEVEIKTSNVKITKNSINDLLSPKLDLIIDASDNFETRYLVDEYSFTHSIPLVYGAIHQYEGQVCVFNFHGSSRYRDLFPVAPKKGVVDNCDINGVLGPVAGTIGCLMATEALKILTGIGKVLSEELLTIRFDDFSIVKMKLPKQEEDVPSMPEEMPIIYHSISAYDLKKAIEENEPIFMLDVRNREQFFYQHIEGSVNIPSDELLERLDEIPMDIQTVVICNIGQASMNVIRYLQNELLYQNLINLDGGVYSYFNE